MATKAAVDFSKLKFYGRQQQLDQLHKTFIKTLHTCSSKAHNEPQLVEVALVHGVCGTGKSMLLEQFCNDLNNNGVCVVEGAFEHHMDALPYSAIVSAISNLADHIEKSEKRDSIITSFDQRTRPEERTLLVNTVPALKTLLGAKQTTSSRAISYLRDDNSFKRFQLVLREFIRTVCTHIQPVVLVLDDLQFADTASLEVIRTLIMDFHVGHFLVIGTFRDEYEDDPHQLAFFLHSLTHLVANVHDVELLNFSVDLVETMILDTTFLKLQEASGLASIIHKATDGNVLFVIHLMSLMAQRGYIYCSEGKWDWSKYSNRIEDMILSNICDVVADEIRQLSLEGQEALKIASCLGSHFQLHVLAQMLHSIGECDLDDYLCQEDERLSLPEKDITETHRLLSEALALGLIHQTTGQARYRFHDRILQAAYSMIPDGSDKLEIHFKLGKLFYRMSMGSGENWLLLAAVTQLNRGSKLIMDRIMKTRLAELNLEATKIVIRQSAFLQATDYLVQGLSLLDKDERWESTYDLALELSSTLAEIAYASRDFVLCKHMVDEVVMHARCLPDKYQVYQTLVRSLSAQGRVDDAFDVGFKLLALLGEKIRPSSIRLSFNMVRLKSTVLGKSDKDLLNLPQMEDEEKKEAVNVLRVLGVLAWVSDRTNDLLQMQFRLIRLTITYGATPFAAAAFAYFGMALSCMGSFSDGHRMGKLSMEMACRNGGDALAVAICQSMLMHWKQPLRESAAPLLEAYHTSMASGFVESSFLCAVTYLAACFESGVPLPILMSEQQRLLTQIDVYGYSKSLVSYFIKPDLQVNLHISGFCKDPLSLDGEIMEEKLFLEECGLLGYMRPMEKVYSGRLFLSNLFNGNVHDVSHYAQRLRAGSLMKNGSHFHIGFYQYLIAMNDISLYRLTGSKRLLRQIEKTIKLLKNYASQGNSNVKDLQLLLHAELGTISNHTEAQDRYDKAIAASQEAKHIHREAFANERAAIFFIEQGKLGAATDYMAQAKRLYHNWGAGTKTAQIREKYAFLFYDSATSKSSRSKKNRNDPNTWEPLGTWIAD